MSSILSKLFKDGVLNIDGEIDVDKLSIEWLKDANYIRTPPPSPLAFGNCSKS